MAAKFWFVNKTQAKSEKEADGEPYQSTELDQLYQFLRFKKLEDSAHQKYGISDTKSGLTSLELHQDFEIRIELGSLFCAVDKHYEITTGKARPLFHAIQENSICCCFRNDYEKVLLTDLAKVPVLLIEKSTVSGYISKKLSFTISHLPCGSKVGEISRIEGFLEKPKYEVSDGHGEGLFSLVIQSEACLHRPNYVLGKQGKTAFLQEDTGGNYQLKIYHLCSLEEKALLVSLTVILDLVKREGSSF